MCMKKTLVIILISIVLILFAINAYSFSTPTKNIHNHPTVTPSSSKPVVFLLIDSLMDEPLQKAIDEGRAPALAFLSQHGQYVPNIVSSYPTMSVTIDSSLLTGTYADEHRIPALSWFNKKENRLVNYGSGAMEIFNIGVKQVLEDNLYNLNQNHLSKSVATIYEDLYEREDDSASINGLVYRGKQNHHLHIPKIASTFNILPHSLAVKGPTLVSKGSLSQFSPKNNRHNNFWQRLGFNDASTAKELKHLIQNDKLPSFTLAYFPDLDQRVHENGPMDLKGIEQVDEQLQLILNEYSSWEEAIENMTLVVYGDSGQVAIGNDEAESLINLRTLLETYQISKLGEAIQTEDQIVLGVNSRMAYIYLLDEKITYTEMASHLIKDSRIGFIAWKDNKGNHVLSRESDSILTFQPNGKYRDQYDQVWNIRGDFSILDLSVTGHNNIEYGHYPDALARLYGALHSHKGRYLIVDAKPSYEFIGEHSPTHLGGGGHGSLHEEDSLTPMIIAGTDTAPKQKRVVDFKEWILELTNH